MSHRLYQNCGNIMNLPMIQEGDSPVKDTDELSSPLTPVTSIARDLSRSRLSSSDTPIKANRSLGKPEDTRRCQHESGVNGLFRNAFRIKGTPDSALKQPAKSSARSRRFVGMSSTPAHRSSPELDSLCYAASSHENLDCAAIFSPTAHNSTPHKSGCSKISKSRLPLEEFDPNSQDSGYGGSSNYSDEKRPNFQFAEPLGVAPRRLSLESRSPMKSPLRSSPLRKRPALFHSLSSGYESTDDGFNDLIDMDSLEGSLSGGGGSKLPSGLSSLISGDIVNSSHDKTMEIDSVSTTPEACPAPPSSRPQFGFRRSLSLGGERLQLEQETSPVSNAASKVRSCLFRSPNSSSSGAKLGYDESPRLRLADSRNFKRPEPPTDEHSPVLVKRSRKCTSFQDVSRDCEVSPLPMLTRSLSETEAHAHIKSAVHRSTTDSDLTGDFSKTCVLPLANGQHEDLKSISCDTLGKLIRGDFADRVSHFKIVDCRYPYEFEAGHIDGALNLYNREMVEKFLLDPLSDTPVAIEPDTHKRNILVFHCEFSWERGPNLSRILRNLDRQRNKEHYPALHYPEIYLLHGGYQKFYKDQKDLCTPQGYRPMRHPDHEADLRQFRSKSKSWQGEKTGRANIVTARANLKRLGF